VTRLATDHGVAFLDWDESRVDYVALDLASIPGTPLTGAQRLLAAAASDAWEAANVWELEPSYARARLEQLRERVIPSR
jgi:hypothetical protein